MYNARLSAHPHVSSRVRLQLFDSIAQGIHLDFPPLAVASDTSDIKALAWASEACASWVAGHSGNRQTFSV